MERREVIGRARANNPGQENIAARVARGIKKRIASARLRWEARRQHRQNWSALLESHRIPREVLFVCYGNICRSAFAEAWVRQHCPELKVRSAGFYGENRPSPEHMQAAARRGGVDLSRARSTAISAAAVESADAVLLLDSRNFADFRQRFPEAMHKILQLGLFLDPPLVDIADPYDFDIPSTEQVCRQIHAATKAFIDAIRKEKSSPEP